MLQVNTLAQHVRAHTQCASLECRYCNVVPKWHFYTQHIVCSVDTEAVLLYLTHVLSIIFRGTTVLLQPTLMLYINTLQPIILFHLTHMLYINILQPIILFHLTHMLYFIIGKLTLFLTPVTTFYDNNGNISLQPSYIFSIGIKNVLSSLLPTDTLYFSTNAIFFFIIWTDFLLFGKKVHLTVYNCCLSGFKHFILFLFQELCNFYVNTFTEHFYWTLLLNTYRHIRFKKAAPL